MEGQHVPDSFDRRRSSVSLRNDFLRHATPYDTPRSDTPNAGSSRGSSPSTKVHFSDGPNPVFGSHAIPGSVLPKNPTMSSFKKRSSVGTATHQMLKWLPHSTSGLAEALEEDSSPAVGYRPGHASGDTPSYGAGILTPPFTPLKKSDQVSMRTPVHGHPRAFEKLMRPETSLITPPDTIPHQNNRPFVVSAHTPGDGSSDSDSTSPTRATAYHLAPSVKPPTSGNTLADQLKRLVLTDNSRRRSASNPTGPVFEFDQNVQQTSQSSNLAPHYGELGSSASASAADYRKRAETISTSATSPLTNVVSDGTPPRRASSSHFHPRDDNSGVIGTPGRSGKSIQVPGFSPSSSNIFASNMPSAHAFSRPPTSHPPSGFGMSEQITELMSPQEHHSHPSPDKLQNPNSFSQPGPGSRQSNERRQRYHTAPVDNNPLGGGTSKEHCGFDPEVDVAYLPMFDGRFDEAGLSSGENFQYEAGLTKYRHPRFRPRSSTMAGVGNRRLLRKSLLSMRWNDEEIEEGFEGDASKADPHSSPSGKTADSTRSSSVTDDVDSIMFQSPINPDLSRVAFERRASEPVMLPRLPPWGLQSSSLLTRYCKILGLSPKLLGSMKGIVRVRNAVSVSNSSSSWFSWYGLLHFV